MLFNLAFVSLIANPFIFKETKQYVRTQPGDGLTPMRCFQDIHCPKDSKCYVEKGSSRKYGVCVVVYDTKLVKSLDLEIWN